MLAIQNKALVLDLLEWIGIKSRDYAELMDAWRTSCPRLPIWEDAVDLGFIACVRAEGPGMVVRVTPPAGGSWKPNGRHYRDVGSRNHRESLAVALPAAGTAEQCPLPVDLAGVVQRRG